MEYKVVSDSDLAAMVEVVNEMLDEGWSLQGGVCIACTDRDDDIDIYAQAMIRKK